MLTRSPPPKPPERPRPVRLPPFDPEAERRRRDLLDVMREESTPGARRIHFSGP